MGGLLALHSFLGVQSVGGCLPKATHRKMCGDERKRKTSSTEKEEEEGMIVIIDHSISSPFFCSFRCE